MGGQAAPMRRYVVPYLVHESRQEDHTNWPHVLKLAGTDLNNESEQQMVNLRNNYVIKK